MVGKKMTLAAPTPLQEMQRVRAQQKQRTTPKLAADTTVRRELRPGSRLAAKLVDILLITSVLPLVILFIEHISSQTASFALWYFSESALPGMLMFAIFPFIEAMVLRLFGTTPGKAILALSITTKEGLRPNFGQLVARAYLCWFYGLGMGIPLVNLCTMYLSRRYLEKNGISGWDARTSLLLVPRQISGTREATTITALFVVYFGVLVIAVLGANAP